MVILKHAKNATSKEALVRLIPVLVMDVITSIGAPLSSKRALYSDIGLKQVWLLIEPRYRTRIYESNIAVIKKTPR